MIITPAMARALHKAACLVHTNFVLLFSLFLMLWHVGPSWSWRDCPSQRQEMTPLWVPFLWKPTSPEPRAAHCLLYGALTGWPLSSATIPQGWVTRQLGTVPTPMSPLKLFKRVHPRPVWPADPVSPIPSQENCNKGSFPCFSLTPSASWPTLGLPCVVLHVIECPSLLRTVTNYLFISNRLPVCWPHHTRIIIKTTF